MQASSTLALPELEVTVAWPRQPRLDRLRAWLLWLIALWRSKAELVRQAVRLQLENQQLRAAIEHDSLTGAYSRLYFSVALALELARFKRNAKPPTRSEPFVVGMLDINGFKKLNDQNHDHQAGDRALIRVVEVAREIFKRQIDVFARWGGDEFVFLLPLTTLEQARTKVARYRQTLLEQAGLSVSIGLAVASADCTQESIVKAADKAMYRAKETGNSVCVAETVQP